MYEGSFTLADVSADPTAAVVAALYRVVLGREPDAAGFAYHLAEARALVAARGVDAGVTELARIFVGSEEGTGHLRRSLGVPADTALVALGRGLPGLGNVVSLGMQCFTSGMLKRFGLKRWSGPFDWIVSSPAMVRHCLADDFRTFLDRSLYGPIPVAERADPEYGRCEHRFYLERFGVHDVFNHYDACEDAAHDYFVRAVARFRAALRAPEPIRFMQTVYEEPGTAAEFAASVDALEAAAPGCTVAVFGIGARAPGAVPVVEAWATRGPHRLYRVRPVSAWRATAFDDPVDELAILRTLSALPA